MEKFFAGLDVSKDETAICVCHEDGTVVCAGKVRTELDTILAFLRETEQKLVRVILGNRSYGKLAS